MRRTALLSIIGLLLTGCASYRYDVAGPDGSAKTVRKDADLVIPAEPAEIRVRQVENRCVFMIENPTTQPVSLDGANSAVVDPTGQSRALAGQLIPPGAYLKLVLPPMAEYEPRGPEFRIGFGMQVSAPQEESVKAHYLMSAAGPMEYWEWSGAGSIRLTLSLVQEQVSRRHEFTITRTKP